MGTHCTHIDMAERRQIQEMVAAGLPVAAIAGRLKREPCAQGTVSHETIYQFVYGPERREERLFETLAQAHRRRRRRFGRRPRRGPFPAERAIVRRPAEVADRAVFGHWEVRPVDLRAHDREGQRHHAG